MSDTTHCCVCAFEITPGQKQFVSDGSKCHEHCYRFAEIERVAKYAIELLEGGFASEAAAELDRALAENRQ